MKQVQEKNEKYLLAKWQVREGDIYSINDKHTYIIGDNMSVELPKVDTILTDPPYQTTDIHFDKEGYDKSIYTRLLECIGSGYLIAFGGVELLGYIASVWSTRYTGVWLKPQGALRYPTAKKPMSRSEFYGVFCKRGTQVKDLTYNTIYYEGQPYRKVGSDGYVTFNKGTRVYTDVIEAPNKPCMQHMERTAHPTQKPIHLLSVLLQKLTNEGDTVLDCFAGSGSTLHACDVTNRVCVSIEKSLL